MTDFGLVNQTLTATAKLQQADRDRTSAQAALNAIIKRQIAEELGADVLRVLAQLARETLDGADSRFVGEFGLLSIAERAWRCGRHHTRQQVARMGWLATRVEQALTLAEDVISEEDKQTLTDAAAIIRRMRGPVDGEDGHGAGTG